MISCSTNRAAAIARWISNSFFKPLVEFDSCASTVIVIHGEVEILDLMESEQDGVFRTFGLWRNTQYALVISQFVVKEFSGDFEGSNLESRYCLDSRAVESCAFNCISDHVGQQALWQTCICSTDIKGHKLVCCLTSDSHWNHSPCCPRVRIRIATILAVDIEEYTEAIVSESVEILARYWDFASLDFRIRFQIVLPKRRVKPERKTLFVESFQHRSSQAIVFAYTLQADACIDVCYVVWNVTRWHGSLERIPSIRLQYGHQNIDLSVRQVRIVSFRENGATTRRNEFCLPGFLHDPSCLNCFCIHVSHKSAKRILCNSI